MAGRVGIVLLGAAVLACRMRPGVSEEVANCATARAAYGNDIAACLIAKYDWKSTDALLAADSVLAREHYLLQRIEDSLRRVQDSISRARTARAQAALTRRWAPLRLWIRCARDTLASLLQRERGLPAPPTDLYFYGDGDAGRVAERCQRLWPGEEVWREFWDAVPAGSALADTVGAVLRIAERSSSD